MKTNKQSLTQQLEALKREKAPERDLWQGIEHAISQGQQVKNNNWRMQVAVAASLFLAIVVGVFSYQQGLETKGSQLAEQMSQQYIKQREDLLVSLANVPTYTNDWQSQLDDLEAAADAIKQALKEDPANPALLRMLKQVYEQQIALIQRVHGPAWQQI